MFELMAKLPLIQWRRVVLIEETQDGILVYREVDIDRFRIGVGHVDPDITGLLDNYFVGKFKQAIAHLH
jgi:hypothetical protein